MKYLFSLPFCFGEALHTWSGQMSGCQRCVSNSGWWGEKATPWSVKELHQSEYVHIHDMYVHIHDMYVNICECMWIYVNIYIYIHTHYHVVTLKKRRNSIILLHVGSCWWRVRRAYDELGKDRLAIRCGFCHSNVQTEGTTDFHENHLAPMVMEIYIYILVIWDNNGIIWYG